MEVSKLKTLLLRVMLAAPLVLTFGCKEDSDKALEQMAARQQELTSDLFVALAIAFGLTLTTLLFIALFVRERSISQTLRRFINQKEEDSDGYYKST